LDMILDAQPGAPIPAAMRPRDDLSEFVSKAVQPHIVAKPTADQEALLEQVDGVIEATMRIVLHHPHFQAAEALWGGVAFLVRRLDTGEQLELYVADVSKTELLGALADRD